MRATALPGELRGEWIWHPASVDRLDSYVFFRKEFLLAEMPAVAELWMTAHSLYHLYVNGRHVSRGPGPAPQAGVYACYHEIGFALQPGKNVIAVLAHHTSAARFSHLRRPAGLWCHLNSDGQAIAWTDRSWMARPGDCFFANQPRISRADGFVEACDMRKYPHGWTEVDYPALEWDPATIITFPDGHPPAFLPTPELDVSSEGYSYLNLVTIGEARPSFASTHVAVARAIPKATGLYAAETFLHSREDFEKVAFGLFCDDPYYLFVNDVLVKQQGGRPLANWSVPEWDLPRLYQQDAVVDVMGWVPLQSGPNRILLVHMVGKDSAGATLVFPQTESHLFRFLRGGDAFSLPGWNLNGPLQLPFANVCESIAFTGYKSSSYYNIHPADVAAHLYAFAYTLSEQRSEPATAVQLVAGRYAVFELERYGRGCPEMLIHGSPGDIIDIAYGDYLTGNVVLPYEDGIRRVYTLILDGKPTKWQAVHAHGMRYLMIFARQAANEVEVQELSLRRLTWQSRESASFACSDELINQIWEVSSVTLDATFDRVFLSSAGGQEMQLLADAMIQALCSLHIFGHHDMSEKALREFARAQFETGEMPAVAPSEFHLRLHDFALLWPTWLQRHILHSGDRKFLAEMLPTLERLLVFFETMATVEGVLLGNLDPPYTLPALIDYDQTADNRGVTTALNSLYCHALLKSEWLFNEAGNADAAHVCNQRATEIAKLLRQLTWDPERGLFADSWLDGERSATHSLQANVLALYSGVARHDESAGMFDKMFVEYAPFHEMPADQANDNPYFKYFILEMAYTLGRRDWAADYLRYYWGKMIEQGATTWWRTFCPDVEYGPEQSRCLCHGYGVSPVNFIISEILGLRPASPGYKQVYFNPLLTAVEWARAQIHTPNGVIQVDWGFNEQNELEVSIDSTYGLEVVPILDPQVAATAIIKVSSSVIILSPPAGVRVT